MSCDPKTFIKYSGALRAYTVHHVDLSNALLNPFQTKKYEYVVMMNDKTIEEEMNKLVKDRIVKKYEGVIFNGNNKGTKIVPLSLINHSSFIIYARREWKIDLLKIENEMNAAASDSGDNSEDGEDDEDGEITYTSNINNTTDNECNNNKNNSRKISLLVIKSDSESEYSSDDIETDEED